MYTIPEKVNRILNIIILALFLIFIRVWYLAIIQHEEKKLEALKPKQKLVIERVERATIRDRFNIPLAANKIQYYASIRYADIRQIPRFKWEKNIQGKLVRVHKRMSFIKELSFLLAKELQMDVVQIEDIIHGKASLFPHTPFVIKKNISEQEYYRLKLLEKDWAGIYAEKRSKRFYPNGKTACDVIGYMSAINQKEYYNIAEELKYLKQYLFSRESDEICILPKGFTNPLQVRERLQILQEKAYTINDLIGKTGIEAVYDAELRGYIGEKTYEVDTKGNLLRSLPNGREATPGQRIILTISQELQEFAERLLTIYEKERDSTEEITLQYPWIKGGAIVAIEPNTGELLAFASYPRFDPNDFISGSSAVLKWLENERLIANIWDGYQDLERERIDPLTHRFYQEKLHLCLDHYIDALLAPKSEIKNCFSRIDSLHAACSLQKTAKQLLELSQQTSYPHLLATLYNTTPHRVSRFPLDEKIKIQKHLFPQQLKKVLDSFLVEIKHNDDKLLLLDLCRLLVNEEAFSSELLQAIGHLKVSDYYILNQLSSQIQHFLLLQAKQWFHELDFSSWREQHFTSFLKQKRQEEKSQKKWAKPYTEYLDLAEKNLFSIFWEKNRFFLFQSFILEPIETTDAHLIPYLERAIKEREKNSLMQKCRNELKTSLSSLPSNLQFEFLRTMRCFNELNRPLLGRYRGLRTSNKQQLEKHLAAAFYPATGYGYGKSYAYRQATPLGSVFKLLVAYQTLMERLEQGKDLNPLTLTDQIEWHANPNSNEQILGYTQEGLPITRLYKQGRLARSSNPNIGKTDLLRAIESSSNIYFSLLASEHIQDPETLIQTSKNFLFGEKTGIELPGEFAGQLPNDLSFNRTGLYAFAIGQHSLTVTPLQTAVMLSTIANKGCVLKPKIVQLIAGQERLREYSDPFSTQQFPFQEHLKLIGIHFPLFTSCLKEEQKPHIWMNSTCVKQQIPLPDPVRNMLLEGMYKVVNGEKGNARPSIIRSLNRHPKWKKNYLELQGGQLIGKTGTAEILYKSTIDAETPAFKVDHIWFAGISFLPKHQKIKDRAELVIVVYLPFNKSGGKEAAPIAAEIVKKWREIKKTHGCTQDFIQKETLLK
ncbi:MAG: penicillin-binding transpeptidase domain-containing protein [Candidatus Rhabdochlamydia sp.]|jgi:cell division protein FtsI/penicillin-binding protein 2